MRRQIVHIDLREQDVPASDRSGLRASTEATYRLFQRKNTRAGYDSIQPHACKANMHKTQNHFSPCKPLAGTTRRMSTSSNSQLCLSEMSLIPMFTQPVSQSLDKQKQPSQPSTRQPAKLTIYQRIKEHNQKLLSKVYVSGTEYSEGFSKKQNHPRNRSIFTRKEEKGRSHYLTSWQQSQRWDKKHQFLRKALVQTKRKPQEKDLKPWEVPLEVQDGEY